MRNRMIIPGIFTILFGLFFVFIAYKFLFNTEKTIRALQELKYKSSSQPNPKAIILTRVFAVILLLIGIYFIGLGISSLMN